MKREILVGILTDRDSGDLALLSHYRPASSDSEPEDEETTIPDLLESGWALVTVVPGQSNPLMFFQRPYRSMHAGSIADAFSGG